MRMKDEQLHQRTNQATNEPLLKGMQVFMLFEAVVCVHRRSVGSAKYEQLLSGMQNFMLFEAPHEVMQYKTQWNMFR